jgi:hypothetical protein
MKYKGLTVVKGSKYTGIKYDKIDIPEGFY